MQDKFKEDLELKLQQLYKNGPSPGDVIGQLPGIGVVVVRSKSLPSGLILDDVENIPNLNVRQF